MSATKEKGRLAEYKAPKLQLQVIRLTCRCGVVSKFPLNPWESVRVELIERRGKPIVSIGRWKLTAAGPRRTGQVFEFGAHRTADIAKMISEVQRHLELDGGAK
jgi:hypothetical protein